MMVNFLLTYCGLWLLGLLFSALRFAWVRPPAGLPAPTEVQDFPSVSILVAARNEAAALPRCLAALRALHYPLARLEILVGDDGSTDGTAAVAEAALRGYAGAARVLPIVGTRGAARGKANVLAQLAEAAKGEVFFITDADIAVPPTWLGALLAAAGPGVGIVTGITAVRGPRLFDDLQGMDWLLSLALVQVVSDLGRPVTAMGNNMLVTRAAYEATGGYAALPFSVTEDYALFRAVLARGYGFGHVFTAPARADSLPMPSWGALLTQRRRWLRGVQALPLRLRLELAAYSTIWPALAALAVVAGPGVALGIWGWKIAVQGLLTGLAFRRAGLRMPWGLLPLFELYTLAITAFVTWAQMRGGKVVWKGRSY